MTSIGYWMPVMKVVKTEFTEAAQACNMYWLVVWTPLKNISQLGWLFPIYGKIKNVPNHQPACTILPSASNETRVEFIMVAASAALPAWEVLNQSSAGPERYRKPACTTSLKMLFSCFQLKSPRYHGTRDAISIARAPMFGKFGGCITVPLPHGFSSCRGKMTWNPNRRNHFFPINAPWKRRFP